MGASPLTTRNVLAAELSECIHSVMSDFELLRHADAVGRLPDDLRHRAVARIVGTIQDSPSYQGVPSEKLTRLAESGLKISMAVEVDNSRERGRRRELMHSYLLDAREAIGLFNALTVEERRGPSGRALLRRIVASWKRALEVDRAGLDLGWWSAPILDAPGIEKQVAAAQIMLQTEQDLERESRRGVRLAAAQASRQTEVVAPHCADCHRPRAFFDEDGTGYCKRHADERGIRPHGKA